MKTELKGLKITSKINGVIQILLSLYWLWHYGILLYYYNFSNILFAFMYPTWTLILFILMGLLGVYIGTTVFTMKRKYIRGYLQIFGLLIIGIIIDMVVIA